VSWEAFQQWLAGGRLVRRLADTLFRGHARRHLAALDHQDAARCQFRTLRGLVHQAQATRFGRDHDFGRIRTPNDFRRLVPLRSPTELWSAYWGPAFPHLEGVTWPAPLPSLIVRPAGALPHIPASPALWAGHRAAALTALSFVAAARPRARLLSGRLLLVGDGPPAPPPHDGVEVGSAESLAVKRLPARLRPYVVLPPDGEPSGAADERLHGLVRRSVRVPVTCVAGRADVLARFFALCKQETGWRRVADVWPGLAAVLYQRLSGGPGAEQLAEEVGAGERRGPVLFLEAWVRPEGAVAVEDPRHGCLRLLADHGVYFEFVPAGEVHRPRPERLGVGEVEPGVPYALALSSAAGVWACRTGDRVCFERRDPPLLRALGSPAEVTPPAPDGRPRNGGIPAGPSGTSARSPSSAGAGRG
jgi:hypothetical protein